MSTLMRVLAFYSAIQEQFEAELDEAPYVAKLSAVLGLSLRFPHGPAQVCLSSKLCFCRWSMYNMVNE